MAAKILIVDDEPEIREIVSFGLSLEGYQVIEAAGGMEAMKIIEQGDIDAVISDVRMPKGDGIYLASALQKLNLELPMYLMTGYTSYDLGKVADIGVCSVFTKPFDTQNFIRALTESLEKQKKVG